MFEFKGGIQTYSYFLLKALQLTAPDRRYQVCLKHDTGNVVDPALTHHTHFSFAGQWPLALRTLVFAGQLFTLGVWQRPSLIITTHVNFAVVAYWLKRLLGIPYWIVAHGVEVWNVQRPALQRALEQADRILAVSHYTRDRLLQEQSLDAARVVLLPNTFEADRFQMGPKPEFLLQRYHLTPGDAILLTVARLSEEDRYKGYDQILRALPAIRRQVPRVHYLLVGKGDDRSRVERLIEELQLQECVTLAGFVPDEELGDYYNLCDVFAMPSKGEGFGIVYLEALSCGKPTLGGNQDGALDALCQGQLGVLVNPDDLEALTEALIQMLQHTYPHPILYNPALIRQKVIETYGFEQFQKTLLKIMAAFEES
ncbi:MAG: glycosyltransferase [Leptolyngbyaceae cyanobacterium bins.59]|nr:glycosyltransferase [Leptolyngbyaceae cyanobacterium bins.59]